MYIELFLLDNTLMNLLILRAAAALVKKRSLLYRTVCASMLAACFAALSVIYPVLCMWYFKAALCILIAMALPFERRVGELVKNALAVMFSTLMTGGACVVLCMANSGFAGGIAVDSVSLCIAILTAVIALLLPNAFRRVFTPRTASKREIVKVGVNGRVYILRAIVDTGNLLTDPVSARPVIVAYIPQMSAQANIPIPVQTVTGNKMLYAFRPDYVMADNKSVDMLIAVSDTRFGNADAIIPGS